MKKYSFVLKRIHYDKSLDDGLLNLYEEGIFIRCFEYSAIIISEKFKYKLFANIDRKTGFIFLEVGFPRSKKSDMLKFLDFNNYNYRFTSKKDGMIQTFGSFKIKINEKYLISLKKDLIILK